MIHGKKPAGVRAKGAALLAAAALLFGCGLAGCGGDDDPDGTPPANKLDNPNITGRSLADALALIAKDTEGTGPYSITLSAGAESGPVTLEYAGRTVAITLTGGKTVALKEKGSLFTVGKGVTLTLDGVALRGIAANDKSLVYVDNGGTLIMNEGSSIKANTGSSGGGGVFVNGGTFTMNEGEISGNTSGGTGGGVFVKEGSTFTMAGGAISGNTANGGFGGGVNMSKGSTFTMSGGEISRNTAKGNGSYNAGGGVYVGGDVSASTGIFRMSGGEIKGNIVRGVSSSDGFGGGGVYVAFNGNFAKEGTGGVIYGNAAGDLQPNRCVDGDGDIVNEQGHAVYWQKDASNASNNKYRDTKVSGTDTLSTKADTGWSSKDE